MSKLRFICIFNEKFCTEITSNCVLKKIYNKIRKTYVNNLPERGSIPTGVFVLSGTCQRNLSFTAWARIAIAITVIVIPHQFIHLFIIIVFKIVLWSFIFGHPWEFPVAWARNSLIISMIKWQSHFLILELNYKIYQMNGSLSIKSTVRAESSNFIFRFQFFRFKPWFDIISPAVDSVIFISFALGANIVLFSAHNSS